ncbi:MAG: YqgE/AlgH family protein [Angustibacter sp.]
MATPALRSPAFARTVIFLLDHGPKGTVGVVLNRPMRAQVDSVLPRWQEWASAPATLFTGGPVGTDQAMGLASTPENALVPNWVRRLVGSTGVIDLAAQPDLDPQRNCRVRIFLGYAGWAPEQLDSEITRGSWFVVPTEAGDILSDRPLGLWRAVLRRQAGPLALVSTYPEDPDLN